MQNIHHVYIKNLGVGKAGYVVHMYTLFRGNRQNEIFCGFYFHEWPLTREIRETKSTAKHNTYTVYVSLNWLIIRCTTYPVSA